MKTNKRNLFIPLGLMISSSSQIVAHFTHVSDFMLGSIVGVGIGVMCLAFLPKRRPTC